MNAQMRSKLSFLPFNLLWCIGTFVTIFFLASVELNTVQSLVIAFSAYIFDVKCACNHDWLEHRIELLEK